jgi:membrane protease YdiL (CAAX protease family)
VPFALCVAGGGVAWAWLYDRSNSLYAPWLSHLLIDAAVMAIGYDLAFGTSSPLAA